MKNGSTNQYNQLFGFLSVKKIDLRESTEDPVDKEVKFRLFVWPINFLGNDAILLAPSIFDCFSGCPVPRQMERDKQLKRRQGLKNLGLRTMPEESQTDPHVLWVNPF